MPHNNGVSRSTGAWSLNGAYNLPIDSLSAVRLDMNYFRLSHGKGIGGANAWSGAAHSSSKMDDIPVGGFVGRFSNNGTATWGLGLETSLPVGKWDWLPGGRSDWADSAVLNLQGFHARTGGARTNRRGSRCELRSYPCDTTRIGVNLDFQHTSASFGGPYKFTDNITSIGASLACLFPCGWSACGNYDHSYLSRSGLKVDGLTLGARHGFGGTSKIRDTEGLGYANFPTILGVSTKFQPETGGRTGMVRRTVAPVCSRARSAVETREPALGNERSGGRHALMQLAHDRGETDFQGKAPPAIFFCGARR